MTIQEAASATGWSPRMLRYIERAGLVAPARSSSRYRIYHPDELERLRALRQLLERFDLELADVAFAARLDADAALREAVQEWLRSTTVSGHEPSDSSRAAVGRYEADALFAALA